MSIIVNDNLRIRTKKLTDARSGPYTSVEQALASINVNERIDGLPVIIGQGESMQKYWFKGNQLVPDITQGSGATGGFEYIEAQDGELHLTGEARIQKCILTEPVLVIDGMSRKSGDSGILILQQDDQGSRMYNLKGNGQGNLGDIYVRNTLPRATTTFHWYRDDRFCYWRIGDTVAGVFPTIKPVIRVDDLANTLEMFHYLPMSELEISTNGGPWLPYTGIINVGAVDRPAGYWRGRVKPNPSRTDSPIEYSLPFSAVVKGFNYTFNFQLS